MRKLLSRFLKNLAREDGISLIMAMGILGVLSIAAGAVVFYASANSGSAERSNADNAAFSLGETGIAEALSLLNDANNPTQSSAIPASRTRTNASGSVTYGGTRTTAADGSTLWTITSTATVASPNGGTADLTRTLTQRVRILPRVEGSDPNLWDRLFHDRIDKCLTISTVIVPSSVTSRGDICLTQNAAIRKSTTNNPTTVRAGDDVFIFQGNGTAAIGANNAPGRVDRTEVGGHCKFGNQSPTTPCSETENVFTNAFSADPQDLRKPKVDFDYWYQHAKPGPNHPCTTQSGTVPVFDNDGVRNGTSNGTGEITPSTQSYSCQVIEDGEVVGELSWNHNTNILTMSGTIFIDGDVRFDDDGDLVNYQGRATIYAGDDIEFDELVCAGGDGSNNCRNDMDNWDPETNMMILISNGWSEYDQGGNLAPAAFQGVVYAEDFCLIHQDVYVSGPMICDEIRIEENDEDQGGGWPTFFSWPELRSLIPGVLYGDVNNLTTYEVELLERTG